MVKRIFSPFLYLLIGLALFTACTRTATETANTNQPKENAGNTGKLTSRSESLVTTISRISILANGDAEYNFNEKQAAFIVAKNNPSFERILALAREAFTGTKPVKLIYTGHNSLEELAWPSEAESTTYTDWYRYNIVNPEPDRRLNPADLNTTYFNTADWQNWKVFRFCTKTVPSLATAKTIFNYCAGQGCYLGPTLVQPCIPFEYVKDGCFARAHKMRWIIESKYGYCSEKVFSYGNLDVKADKWGGCCVGWIYHVAPLIRVKSGSSILCYVIDPGMFNEPVLLSTWLAAQGNTGCDATSSGATAYSIQPSSAYTPAQGYNSSTYTTDPNYSITNNDLVYYNNAGNTCN